MNEEEPKKKFSFFDDLPPKKSEPKIEEPKKEDKPKEEEVDYKAKYEDLSIFDHEEAKALRELIEAEEGEAPKEKLGKFVNKAKEAVTKVKELTEKEQEREQWFKANQIVNSAEFREKYVKPVDKALDLYNGLLGENDAEGKPRYEDMYVKLRTALFKEGNDITVPEVKGVLAKFSEQYATKFGSEPKLPTVKEVLEAREDLIKAQERKINAVKTWEDEKKNQTIAQKNKEAELLAERRKALLRDKENEFNELAKSFDYDYYEGFFPKEKVEAALKESNDTVKGVLSQEKPDIKYGEYLTIMAKAKLFDDLLSEASKLKSFKEEYNSGRTVKIKKGDATPEKKEESKGKVSDFFGI